MKRYHAALIGIGGFGKTHTAAMAELTAEGAIQCVAFAEPNVEANKPSFERLTAIGATHYEDYKEMLERHPEIDFVVLATPIPLHKPMSVYAMEHGVHVMTEKPPAVTVQDVDAMIETSRRTGKQCGVLFQMTSETAFRLMVEKLREGAIGELRSVTGVGLWHRTDDYYNRTPWAGQLLYNGQYVLDGTLNNPLSHVLNNCLIAAGYGDADKALPRRVQAELYHGHRIPAEDTSCVRIDTENGVRVYFYATLCHHESLRPYILLQGTKGTMRWTYDNSFTLTDESGAEQQFTFGKENLTHKMYLNFIDTLEGKIPAPYCPIAACRSFMLASNGAFESARNIHPIPEERWPELAALIEQAAGSGKLFSELGAGWAVGSEPFDLRDYRQFTLFT